MLIDSAKYQEWTPPSEDDFERVVEKHAEDIFGKDAKYFDLKHRLASRSGTGSIPDGYAITLGDKPGVRIIELELASHSLQHIVSQMVNIINGIENPTTQQKICNAIEDGINEDEIFVAKIEKAIKPVAIHRFLSDSFSNTLPIINIIIDKNSPVLEETISKITPPPKIIEFQTFTREGVGLEVHAHLFEPPFQRRSDSLGNQAMIIIEERRQKLKSERARGLKLYVKDGKRYNPMEALVALGATLNKMVEGQSDRRAIMADGIILEYVGSTKNGKSKIPKVHAYLLDHGFTFQAES